MCVLVRQQFLLQRSCCSQLLLVRPLVVGLAGPLLAVLPAVQEVNRWATCCMLLVGPCCLLVLSFAPPLPAVLPAVQEVGRWVALCVFLCFSSSCCGTAVAAASCCWCGHWWQDELDRCRQCCQLCRRSAGGLCCVCICFSNLCCSQLLLQPAASGVAPGGRASRTAAGSAASCVLQPVCVFKSRKMQLLLQPLVLLCLLSGRTSWTAAGAACCAGSQQVGCVACASAVCASMQLLL
jgi:hypothetical protein